jgi:penicillin-binding protein 2
MIVTVLVGSMVLTLFGRLYYVQLLDPNKPSQLGDRLHLGAIVMPAPRGQILDSRGRPLVQNVARQVITVDRQALDRQPDHGAAVLARLGAVLKIDPALLAKQITPCSPRVPAPCWTGPPYQPVPVATSAPTSAVLEVSEHREQYPGVTLQTVTLPSYPNGSLAAQVLGYTGQVTAADLAADPDLDDADSIGLSGLEQQYDSALRGVDGRQYVQLDPRGISVGSDLSVPATPGDTLVTSIDASVQKLVETSLLQQIADTRKTGKPATSGSVVVMDPNTGRILAMASWPTYNPELFSGGISDADYARLIAPSANAPLLNRATDGQYAPGSTFKLITASSLVMHNEISLQGTYPCPGSLAIDGRVKTNYDSESFGYPITLENALGFSCDTFFYAPAADEYYRDQARIAAGQAPAEYLQHMAAAFGVGTKPGIDLPADEQATGSYADREIRLAQWQANKATWCAEAKQGYPEVSDPAQRAYLTLLASQNCTDGWRYRAGDNADMAIGQGDTTLSPLQLSIAYSALVNGGRIWQPTLGWAVVDGSGKVVKTITPTVRSTVPVSQPVLNYIASSLSFSRGWAVSGAYAYIGSPIQNMLGGKTGTAEVFGKQDTAWLSSWGPVSNNHGAVSARFVVTGMIEQGGTGATSAGPMLKRIWDGLLGAGQPAVLPGSKAPTALPKIAPQIQVTGGSAHLPPALDGTGGPPAVPTYRPRPGGVR